MKTLKKAIGFYKASIEYDPNGTFLYTLLVILMILAIIVFSLSQITEKP
jgi:hypothetical protein